MSDNLPFTEAVERFGGNEERINLFVNDPENTGSYTDSEGREVKTIPALSVMAQELEASLGDPANPINGATKIGRASVTVESLEELAGLSRSKKLVAQLHLGGRSGKFYWNGSDLSVEVTADTDKLVYVAPADDVSGENGAWIRAGVKAIETQWYGDLTDTSILSAATLGYKLEKTVFVSAGNYTGSGAALSVPSEQLIFEFSPAAVIPFSISISGNIALRSNAVTVPGAFEDYLAGTTTFPGDFSDYAPGDTVMIELSAGGSQAYNEAGIDFAVVDTANASQLVLTTGTRLAYRDPIIHKITNARKHTGDLARNAVFIPGDYTDIFSTGDVLRIENTAGTYGVQGSEFYFELSRISGITVSGITLEARLTHRHVNPWLVKSDFVKGVRISGAAELDRLIVSKAENMFIKDVFVKRTIFSHIYRYAVDSDYRRGLLDSSTSNNTWMFNGTISNVHAQGSLSSFDNACFKVMSCPNMQLNNISGSNATAISQGNYTIFVDYFYTPYRIWNENMQAANLRAEQPNGGSSRSAWLTGIRNGDISVSGRGVFLQRLVDTRAKSVGTEGLLEIQDCARSTIDADARHVYNDGGVDTVVNATVRDTQGGGSNRCFWARSGNVHPETGGSYTATNNEFNIVNYSENPSDTTLYIQNQTNPLVGPGCRDKAGIANSVSLGGAVVMPRMAPNFLSNFQTITGGWVGAQSKGFLNFSGDYRDAGLVINGSYLWVDSSGVLRIDTAKPGVNNAGTVVGNQT